ncbi:NACHT domain-containing protein [Streptomyces sulphureus]|uniref:NACHT domain-containing protein n=1 Tax=Streptomyces sulphureus TaxID=47758 RepID=UPI00036D6B7D|nr:NACHT domain-containing protein [Streptomyces sulphureus]
MQGLEVALGKLAGAVGGAVANSLLPKPGAAGLVDGPVRRPRAVAPERLVTVLARRLDGAYAGLAQHERLAAVDAVRRAFVAAGPLDADRLFACDLDAEALARTLPAYDDGLAPRAAQLRAELQRTCCAHLVEQLTAHPGFAARAAVEERRESRRTRESLHALRDRLGPRQDAEDVAFEQRYAEYVAETYARIDLFGVTLGRAAGEWPLETAYLSLAVSTERNRPEREGMGAGGLGGQAVLRVEQALDGTDRMLLRGPAGSGKSTLVQWAAVNAARRSFEGDLRDWNRCVPFVLRLRSFVTTGRLPDADDFLRATGVPFHGAEPRGWVDRLLDGGRALVLVDGVDEVPERLRARTESWLKRLVTAYPEARYLVTSRSSAIPERWLEAQQFVPHTLLPMQREEITEFVRHWHEAARSECDDARERQRLDGYETSLKRAVGSRRDLGLLATNPLMCALLCALNRDRRMQLPRARKELYDAALDMLLVRRDTEREIEGVEGVELTRDELAVLLQRLAYWLIRNGQVEVDRSEAVAMVAEWLGAMPQVDGTPEQVFAHLLIRTGLLREPAPGTVDFVHRTFQDYLGARAAVEARDFGVLAAHAHEDAWHDVVRMAMGHAREDERGTLLRRLLARADVEPGQSKRLVLLAASSLEQVATLEAGLREEVEDRAAELVPPVTVHEAEALAEVGELVLEHLPGPGGLREEEALGVVLTIRFVGTERAFERIKEFVSDERRSVREELTYAWESFDATRYAEEVLSVLPGDEREMTVQSESHLAALPLIGPVDGLQVRGDHGSLRSVRSLGGCRRLTIDDNRLLRDVADVASLRSLDSLHISACSGLSDLGGLAGTGIRYLSLDVHHGASLRPLAEMPNLETLELDGPLLMESLRDLPVGPQLRHLHFAVRTRYVSLDGIERWPRLSRLTVGGEMQANQLREHPSLAGVGALQVLGAHTLAPDWLTTCRGLTSLLLHGCGAVDLSALRELPGMRALTLADCGTEEAPVDITPLLHSKVRISVHGETYLTGGEHLPSRRFGRYALDGSD